MSLQSSSRLARFAIVLAITAVAACTSLTARQSAVAGSSTTISVVNNGAGYHVVRRIPIGGEGFWDYLAVDTSRDRLFISHSVLVNVLDLARDSLLGEIPNTPGVHGIAIAYGLGRGFTSDGRDSTVRIFDLATLGTLGVVHISAKNPDAIYYDEASQRVFTMNGGSNSATAIDARTDEEIGAINLGGKPEFAQGDGNGRIFVNIESTSEIVAFDARALTVWARWPLAPCESPSGMAIDRVHGRLFVGCDNHMMAVVNTSNGHIVATVPIGDGVDANAFDDATQLAFASTGDGNITVVHEDAPDHYTVIKNVTTEPGARTMAVDLRTHRLYTVTAQFGPAPAPTADRPHPRPTIVPGSFTVLEIAP